MPTITPNVRSSIGPSAIFGNVSWGMVASKATQPRSYLCGVFTGGEGLPPAADVGGQTVRFRRPPRALVVEARGRRVGDHGVDDAPLLFERVPPAEPARIALHRVLEEALVGLGAMTEHALVRHLEVDRPRGERVARCLGLEV